MNNIKYFNLRVYGIFIDDAKRVLLSDEYVLDQYMVKFPGGGLKLGEGPEECILRECIEEFGQEIEILDHFYTTGFFQKALFYDDHQLISIYYLTCFKEKPNFRISETPFDFKGKINGSQSFRWIPLRELHAEDLSFPIDRHVAGLLKEKYL
jgi:ADP-ribose pyrophosphatase YjhB (NUDIX family)